MHSEINEGSGRILHPRWGRERLSFEKALADARRLQERSQILYRERLESVTSGYRRASGGAHLADRRSTLLT